MDIVSVAKYLYKRIEDREQEIGSALVHGSVQNWEQYKMLVGEIRGLSFAREEIKALLENNVDDVEDLISS